MFILHILTYNFREYIKYPTKPTHIKGYHQLRSAIAQVGGKKELIGYTD